MSLLVRLRHWWRRLRGRAAAAEPGRAQLREFVYLDDVSVYSLMASRKGSIPTEFTDNEANTIAGEIEGSFDARGGIAGVGARSKSSTSRTQSSQVLRKSSVQSAFKDLFELEQPRLVVRAPLGDPPAIGGLEDLGTQATEGGWAIEERALGRGELVELEVELEAEAVFRINAVFSAFLEMFQEDLAVFGVAPPSGIREARALTGVLDKLLTGLVPLRGSAVDFAVVHLPDREIVVHRALIDQLPLEIRPPVLPLVVVGVAEQRLFWKDIRRVAFSNSRYRVFGRISDSGLKERWTPVKLANVLRIVAPQFENQLLGAVGEEALRSIGDAVNRDTSSDEQLVGILRGAATRFANGIAEHHGLEISADQLEAILVRSVDPRGSLDTTDSRRQFYRPVRDAVDHDLGVVTPPVTVSQLRLIATSESGVGLTAASSGMTGPAHNVDTPVRFLDMELVAIYW